MTVIDAWTDPSNPPTTNQFPRSYGPNDGITKLLDKIKGIETNLRDVRSHLLEAGAPIASAAVNLTTTAFAPTSTWAEVVGLDLTVPTGCTRLLVTASAWVYAVNNSAAVGNLNARVSLAAVDGQAFLTPIPAAGFNTISAGLAVLADSLVPGATIRLKASAKTTTGAWTTDAANTATLVASLTWLR